MGAKRFAAKMLGLLCVAVVLLRVNLAIGFGEDTGYNKVFVSPLSVTAFLVQSNIDRVPQGGRIYLEKFMTALAMPGELATEYGIYNAVFKALPKGTLTISKRSLKPPKAPKGGMQKSIELRARDWIKAQRKSQSMVKLMDENTFIWTGSVVILFSCLLAAFFPIECFQNILIGMICFWVGLNGAHGEETSMTNEFYGLLVLLALAIFVLPDANPAAEETKKKKAAERATRKAKEEENDDWDDGIGGVTMDDIRKRGTCNDECCG